MNQRTFLFYYKTPTIHLDNIAAVIFQKTINLLCQGRAASVCSRRGMFQLIGIEGRFSKIARRREERSHSYETGSDRRRGDAFSRNVGRRSPEDILPIDRRQEEEGAQSVLMNEATRGP